MGYKQNEDAALVEARDARIAAVAAKTARDVKISGEVPPEPTKAPQENSPPQRRQASQPDMSRIRKSPIEESPAQYKKRRATKIMNFGATIAFRLAVLAALAFYVWRNYGFSGQPPQELVIGFFVVTADLARVSLKALSPQSS